MSFFFFKQKTAYELRISDWSSDVCSSDLGTDDKVFLNRRIKHQCRRQTQHPDDVPRHKCQGHRMHRPCQHLAKHTWSSHDGKSRSCKTDRFKPVAAQMLSKQSSKD